MISHDRAEELISARLDAPLSAADHQALHTHLATCPTCRAFAAHADALVRGLNVLPTLAPSPVVTLNRAVATWMVHGADAGLAVVDEAATRLPADHPRLLLVRAHLVEQSGDVAAARDLFRRAADVATSRPERERLLLLAAHDPA